MKAFDRDFKLATLQNIENSDDSNPTFKVICKIADVLEVSIDELRKGYKGK